MKISYNWLKDFLQLEETPEQLSKMLTNAGLEVEAVEKFENIKGGLENVVVGKVLTCEKHPNADKLRVTTVQVGENEVLPIVCGAPNVAAGQKVVVAKVGAVLYPTDAEKPLEIAKAKIRGEVSEGMICAEDELGLGHSHDGIIVLPEETPIGLQAKELFNIVRETYFEIGLTPNRIDAASHLGVARDLAVVLKKNYVFPDLAKINFSEAKHIKLEIEDPNAVPYYSGAIIKGLSVKESPEWLKNRLKTIGVRPINNVVDITNYVLHELGNPLHAFDLKKVDGSIIKVGYCDENTLFKTLDGVERKLSAQDLMIKNASKPMCLAGVMGGEDSGVNENTTEIFLEAACFDADIVRKSSQKHGLKSDSSFRFERGTDPMMPPKALARAVKLILEIAGGELLEAVEFKTAKVRPYFEVKANWGRIRNLIGISISNEEMKTIFERLEMKVSESSNEDIIVQAPTYRVDVTREADLAEDVLRIVGLDQVLLSENLGTTYIAEHPETSEDEVIRNVSNLLAHQGFFEMVCNSLTSSKRLKYLPAVSEQEIVQILNPLSEELNIMRPSMVFSGLEAIAYNLNRKQKDLKLFELGKIYSKKEKGYEEQKQLSLWLTGDFYLESWRQTQRKADFYDMAELVFGIFQQLGVFQQAELKSENLSDEIKEGVSIVFAKQKIGQIGFIKPELLKEFGIKQPVIWANLDFEKLFNQIKKGLKVKEISKFPEVRRDLSLVLDKNVSFDELKKLALGKKIKDINLFDVYEGDKIEQNKKAYALSFMIQPTERTLTDEEVDNIMSQLIQGYEKEFGAMIRK
ncbi:MAG: phenylalanine--tRNA ligase subunit beta [Cytophagales bacterium]